MNEQELNTYIKKVVAYSFDANKYFNDSEPWALKKTDTNRMNTIMFTIVEQIKNISILLNPLIPNATNKILDIINIPIKDRNIESIKKNNILNHALYLKKVEILFAKVENDH
jgi:methionyl-tRNA synthetase